MCRTASGEIPFGALVSITTRARSVYLNCRLRPLGLSAGQFPILMLLLREQNIMQDDLVRHYRLDKGAIARSVKKLEESGHIRRITDPGNRRAVRLFLTEKGIEAIPYLRDIDREWEECICAGFSNEEKQSLSRMMCRIADSSLLLPGESAGVKN